MHGIARGNSLSPIDPFTGFSAPRSEAGLAGVGDARKMIRGVVDEHSDVIKTLLKIVFLLALLLCMVPMSVSAQVQPPAGFPATINEVEDSGAFPAPGHGMARATTPHGITGLSPC
jgi:hypothetical protein